MLIDSVHPDDVVRVRTTFAAAIEARAPYSSDYRLRGSDGAYRWHLDCGAPRFGSDGAFEGHVGTMVDVHARTMLQKRLEDVAFAGNIGVWYSDAPFDAYQLNPQMASHLDLPGLADVPLRDVLAAVGQDDRSRLDDAIATALRDGAPLDIELTNKAGTRWLRAIGWCGMNENGEPVRFDGVTLDISSHKRAEHELQRLADALAGKNRMQSEFLFTLAHELRNPLAPIRTGLELMRVAPNAATATRVQAIMRRQVDHMAHLVDDLLDMARLSEGKVELQREAVALDGIVNEAVDISMPLVDASRHTLARHLPAGPVILHIDRHRMVQVLSNLLNNAAKYSPPGSAIDIAAHVDGGSIVIAVLDNGIGIDATMLPVVFDMYAQAPQSNGTAQGLGVGLNLVKRLVELHGGSIEAYSAGLGHGSRFTVTLPLGAAAAAPAAVTLDTALAAPGSLRILVVDDNVDASHMLGALLELRGHAVHVVHDGAAALDAAAGFAPDVVFLDIGLPDQSGYDVAVALRQRPGMAAVTLVALTGWGAEQDRRHAHAAGFDAHLTKPADLASVERVLQDAAEKIANR
jgi:signal transduction histidine kinase/ActR/RegA family two-component response regulator